MINIYRSSGGQEAEYEKHWLGWVVALHSCLFITELYNHEYTLSTNLKSILFWKRKNCAYYINLIYKCSDRNLELLKVIKCSITKGTTPLSFLSFLLIKLLVIYCKHLPERSGTHCKNTTWYFNLPVQNHILFRSLFSCPTGILIVLSLDHRRQFECNSRTIQTP